MALFFAMLYTMTHDSASSCVFMYFKICTFVGAALPQCIDMPFKMTLRTVCCITAPLTLLHRKGVNVLLVMGFQL